MTSGTISRDQIRSLPDPHVRAQRADLRVVRDLVSFIETRALFGLNIRPDDFWPALSRLSAELQPQIRHMLAKRAELRTQMSAHYRSSPSALNNSSQEQAFLTAIGYLEADVPDFQIDPIDLPPELAQIAAPQLYASLDHPQRALGVMNARWGSLYHALLASDIFDQTPDRAADDTTADNPTIRSGRFNKHITDWASDFLDDVLPLTSSSWHDIIQFSVDNAELVLHTGSETHRLRDPQHFAGYRGTADQPTALLLKNNGLCLSLFLPSGGAGGSYGRPFTDIRIETATTAILDLSETIGSGELTDKLTSYETWLDLMRGELRSREERSGHKVTEVMVPDALWRSPDGLHEHHIASRCMPIPLLGNLHCTSAAAHNDDKSEVPELLLDIMVLTLGALHNCANAENSADHGLLLGGTDSLSLPLLVPGLQSGEEVSLLCHMMHRVEDVLGLKPFSLKLGLVIDDERLALNLRPALFAAKERIFCVTWASLHHAASVIETAGDGAIALNLAQTTSAKCHNIWQKHIIDCCLQCGFAGRARIGAYSWVMPDTTGDMLAHLQKALLAGASQICTPSPEGAILHATQFHRLHVMAHQKKIAENLPKNMGRSLSNLLGTRPLRPVGEAQTITAENILGTIENEGLRLLELTRDFVDSGRIPRIPRTDKNQGPIFSRDILRHARALLANWVQHGLIAPEELRSALHSSAMRHLRGDSDKSNGSPLRDLYDDASFEVTLKLVMAGNHHSPSHYESLLQTAHQSVKTARRRANIQA